MSKHTPGPWHVANDIDGGLCIEADRGTHRDEIVVARWEGGSQCRIAMSDADARLIAAAPDLLAALKAVEMARLSDTEADWLLATKLTDKALAKAEGR